MPNSVGKVSELWRYPVKSLAGEPIPAARCLSRGLEGDRWWAVRGADGKFGSGKSTRRFRQMTGLLLISAALDPNGLLWIRFPDGTSARGQDPETQARLSRLLREPVTLSEEAEIPHFDQAPLHLVTTSSLRWLADRRPEDFVDRRRFRPNLVVETDGVVPPERGWIGQRLEVGRARLEVMVPTERCVMVTLAQAELPSASRILQELREHAEQSFGVYARVLEEGEIRQGDDVRLLDGPQDGA